MRRIRIMYEDGANTYGDLDIESNPPTICTGGSTYDVDAFAATGATVAVNDEESLKVLVEHGVKARPTGQQTKITASLSDQLKYRLTKAAKDLGMSVSSLLSKVSTEWLDKNGY